MLATSVVMGVTGAAPFNGASDQSLSVAYTSAFILVFLVIFFFCALPSEIIFSYTRIGNTIPFWCPPIGCYGLCGDRY